MNEKNKIVNKWNEKGFLFKKTNEEKNIISKKLETAEKFINDANYSTSFNEMVFPLIIKLSNVNHNFNVERAIIDFYKNIVNNNLNSNNLNSKIKYIDDFVNKWFNDNYCEDDGKIKLWNFLKHNIKMMWFNINGGRKKQ